MGKVTAPPLDMVPTPEDTALGMLRDWGLVNRLSVRHALADYVVTEENLRLAVARQYPDVTLGPGYSYDRGDHLFNLSVGFTVPLFHDERDAIAQAVALRQKAAAQLETTQAQAMGEIDTALTRYRAAYASMVEAGHSTALARDAVDAAQRRLAMGAADRGEVLTAQIVLVQAQRFRLDAQKAIWDALGALEDSVQRPIWPASALTGDQPSPSELMP